MSARTLASTTTVALWAVLVIACQGGEARPVETPPTARQSVGVVDSIHPIEEEIRRFAAMAGGRPSALSGGDADRDSLVRRFVDSLLNEDTTFLRSAILDPAEFIHLYFPHTVYARPPYEMDPAFIWFQIGTRSSVGIDRALKRFGGRALEYLGHDCPPPSVEGPNTVWERCTVTLMVDGEVLEVRLFGPVLARDGEVKFVSYANEF